MENSIGSKIRNIRNILGLTQTEFAEKLGYSYSLISKVEAGTRKAPDRLIKLISSTFNTDLADTASETDCDTSIEELIMYIKDTDALNNTEKAFLTSYLELTPEKRKVISDFLKTFAYHQL